MIFKKHSLPFLFGIALTGCAVFIYPQRSFVLIALMLFLPILDRDWHLTTPLSYKFKRASLYVCVGSLLILTTLNTDYAIIALSTIFLTALPEEWFFRGYFMTQINKAGLGPHQSNLITSLLFTLLHLPTQGLIGLSVFLPSLIYGFIYQKTNDIIFIILLHALSNLIFYIYIIEALNKILIQ